MAGDHCTTGFLESLRVPQDQLIPLLEREGRELGEQWIFPDLHFICPGRVSKWNFSLIMGEDFTTSCSIDFTTWRVVENSRFPREYRRITTTAGNIQSISSFELDGPLYTYELRNPMPVEPGDIVGIAMGSTCINPENFDNIRSLNDSVGNPDALSYRGLLWGTRFILDFSETTKEEFGIIPLLIPVYGQLTQLTLTKFST